MVLFQKWAKSLFLGQIFCANAFKSCMMTEEKLSSTFPREFCLKMNKKGNFSLIILWPPILFNGILKVQIVFIELGGTWYNAEILVGPWWYGFYPINHWILRIHGKFRPGTKKLQTTLSLSAIRKAITKHYLPLQRPFIT